MERNIKLYFDGNTSLESLIENFVYESYKEKEKIE